ncbi:MAG: VapC toxin family PIN domain ribonuclease [Maricaulaceae bacterium]
MSAFLFDTNILSETTKSTPDAGVLAFLDTLSEGFISVLSIHEIAYGLERLPRGPRRSALTNAMETLLGTFGDTILPIRQQEARCQPREVVYALATASGGGLSGLRRADDVIGLVE